MRSRELKSVDEWRLAAEEKPHALRFYWQRAVCAYDSDLSNTERLVALVISTHMDADGTDAWMSAPTLRDETRLGKSTVKRDRRRLECKGWLIADRLPGKTTNYAAAFPGGQEVAPPGQEVAPPGQEVAPWGPGGGPEVVLEVVEDLSQHARHADERAVRVPWESVRRDRCRTCERLAQVNGEGLCNECWAEERAA